MSAIIEQARAERGVAKPARLPIVDAARGAALLAMVVYHLTWDLGFFRLIDPAIPTHPLFKLYGHAIAASFMALAGVSLVLAARPDFCPKPYLARLAMLLAASGLITLVTFYAFPESFIFFGILHCIAIASLIALPFLRAPIWLTVLAAAAILAMPFVVRSELFDQPVFWWTGLGLDEPSSNDWRPFFPWVGFTLIGVAAMRAALDHGLPAWFANWRDDTRPARALTALGRHSLLFYLVHQPVLMGLLFVGVQIAGPRAASEETPFVSACETKCQAVGNAPPVCSRFCGCIVIETRAVSLWRKVLAQSLTPSEQERLDGITRQCARSAAGLNP